MEAGGDAGRRLRWDFAMEGMEDSKRMGDTEGMAGLGDEGHGGCGGYLVSPLTVR